MISMAWSHIPSAPVYITKTIDARSWALLNIAVNAKPYYYVACGSKVRKREPRQPTGFKPGD
jgi:hypothetical protein